MVKTQKKNEGAWLALCILKVLFCVGGFSAILAKAVRYAPRAASPMEAYMYFALAGLSAVVGVMLFVRYIF